MEDVTELLPNLFVSDVDVVRDIPQDHPFDEVVTLGYKDIFGYESPEISTTGDQFTFRDGPHDFYEFELVANYVINSVQDGKCVLVHCQAGRSRSTSVCCTAIAVIEDISVEQALEYVKRLHPKTRPDPRLGQCCSLCKRVLILLAGFR